LVISLSFVCKRALIEYFLDLGSLAGVIFVERKKGSTAVEALKAAAHDIKKIKVLFSRNVIIGMTLTLTV